MGFSRVKINVNDSDESNDIPNERSTSKRPKIIQSSDRISKNLKPLKSILKKQLKTPILNTKSLEKSSKLLNPLRLPFHKRFANKISGDQCNDQDIIIIDENVEMAQEECGDVEMLERPFLRHRNEAAMQTLRSIGADIIIWMRLTRSTKKHAMVHLSVNFPINLAGETAIRWAGIDPHSERDWHWSRPEKSH